MSVRRAFAWSLAGQLLSFVATFGTTVALARILSPREVGIYAAGLAVVGMLQAISAFGVGTFIVRDRDLNAGTLATAFTINAFVCALLAAIVFAASWSPWVTAGEPAVGQVLRLLALIPLLGALEFRPATMLQREMGFRAISLVTIARTVASAVVSVAAALMGASALSAAYGGLAYAIVGVVGFGVAARGHVSFAVSVRGWRTMVAFGLKTLAIGGVSVLTMRLSDFLLGRILGFAPLGYYSRASGLSNTVFQNLYGSAARVLFAKLADDDRAGAGLGTAYLRGLDVILALMWPLLAGIAVLAGPVTVVLFGERWLPAAPPLAILMVAQMLALAFAMNHELFVLRDQVGRQGKLEAIRSVIGLAAFAYGCTWGLAGAAAGRVVDSLVGVALYVPMLSGLSGVRKRALLVVYARAGLLTVAAVAPAVALMWHFDWAAAVPLGSIGVAVALGMALWAALLRVTRHPLVDEIARVVGATRMRALWTPLSTPPS